jgi:D-serine deaminase-like pyridoxal phosphate-dependent protein
MTSPALAELYVNSGIDDILITREVYGKNKIARLCGLSMHGDITLSVDDVANARQISSIATEGRRSKGRRSGRSISITRELRCRA